MNDLLSATNSASEPFDLIDCFIDAMIPPSLAKTGRFSLKQVAF